MCCNCGTTNRLRVIHAAWVQPCPLYTSRPVSLVRMDVGQAKADIHGCNAFRYVNSRGTPGGYMPLPECNYMHPPEDDIERFAVPARRALYGPFEAHTTRPFYCRLSSCEGHAGHIQVVRKRHPWPEVNNCAQRTEHPALGTSTCCRTPSLTRTRTGCFGSKTCRGSQRCL